ncbi:MAG: ATP-dependent DNA helicase RecG [Bacteroidota bacterium]
MHASVTPSDPSSTPVQFVRGIGPKKSAILEQFGIRTVYDLLLHIPRRYLDRTAIVSVRELRTAASAPPPASQTTAPVRREFTVLGEVRSFRVLGVGAKSRFVLVLADATGSMQCIWFGGVHYWKRMFRIGETLAVSGQPSFYGTILQMVHPDIDRITPPEGEEDDEAGVSPGQWMRTLHAGGLIPLYPSGQDLARVGLDSGGFRRAIWGALQTFGDSMPEMLPPSIIGARRLAHVAQAVRAVHFPTVQDELDEGLRRLKYEELFLFQLKLALKRHLQKDETQGIAFSLKSALARGLADSLPFKLTRAQVRVIKEISADMASPRAMNRLLQGDVGSGKTIVAVLAMLIAVDNEYQAVFMAPTELLAEQHWATLSRLLRGLPVTIRLLVGAQRSTLRRDVLEDLRRGSAQIVVGTHALFEKEVSFARLGLVVIDEQHRFGVMQRASLREKGLHPDVLVMTATPIPRTLSLTLYGDLDVSVIDELPPGRTPIKTVVRGEGERDAVAGFVRQQIASGRQAYYVYPLIEESEKLDLKAATVYYDHLRDEVFPGLRLGLMHGRLRSEERDEVMARFLRREIDILVATTVIEVGIDVPNATVMVIEDAERFGLAQLHQLRGRVGRGSEQAYCILFTKSWVARNAGRAAARGVENLTSDQERLAELRLAALVSTTDGFAIAETDLRLRGPGDFFGTRQSGLPEFRVADIIADGALLNDARADAFALVDRDPHLLQPEHRALAAHLRARWRDEMKLLRVG